MQVKRLWDSCKISMKDVNKLFNIIKGMIEPKKEVVSKNKKSPKDAKAQRTIQLIISLCDFASLREN